ncbi:MAG: DUF4981 domain-containing protein [Clostridiaceae bacterium]|nr:DUF4981 domain-containing protein [Clostridiaceae bacterium]
MKKRVKKVIANMVACSLACGLLAPAEVKAEESLTAEANAVQRTEFTGNEWTGKDGNIDITTVNTLPDSCNPIPYADHATAYSGAKDYNREGSAYYQLLTGEEEPWDLIVTENPEQAEELGEFWQSSYELNTDNGWKEVELPASWTSYGFDYSIYTNSKMPFQTSVSVPEAPEDQNPVGLYRKSFVVKDSMLQEDGKVYLTFGGVESAYYVWLNGQQVGYSEDSYSPHTFDITDLLNDQGEENILAVKVYKFSDATWLEDQDMIYDGGIFRDVYLTSTSLVHVQDYSVETDLSDDYSSAALKLKVAVQNDGNLDAENLGLKVELYDTDTDELFQSQNFILQDTMSAANVETEMQLDVENPKLWDADHPNLYTMILSLYDTETGEEYENVSQNVGFRELSFTSTEVEDRTDYVHITTDYDTVKINGKRLIIKGVNRHDTDPETGKYVSHEVYETDVKLMKKNNINAIRTSHYANDDYLYYLCDKYGLYLMCETNNESHALQNKSDLSLLESAAMDRQVTSYERFKNTTANIMWSIGNESVRDQSDTSLADAMFAKMIWYFKDQDSTRPVHFEGYCSNNTATGGVDMVSHMYPSFSSVQSASELSNHMPYLMCEYNHAMGNAVGSMKEYWDIVRSSDNMLGGFIWDWVDQSRKIALDGDSDQWDYYATENAHASGLNDLAGYYLGYGGDWGDTKNDGNFCQNGLVSADRDPQPELKEVKYQYQDFWFTASEEIITSNVITIKNESVSKNLSEYNVVWELKEDDEIISNGTLDIALSAGQESEVAVPFEMPKTLKEGAEYYLNISVQTKEDSLYADKGSEIAWEQFEVSADVEIVEKDTDGTGVTVEQQGDNYLISGDDFSFEVNTSTGRMQNYVYQGETVLLEGPVPNLDRAKLDNDKSLIFTGIQELFMPEGEPVVSTDSDGRQVISVSLKAAYKKGDAYATMIYTVQKNGAVNVNVNIDLTNVNRSQYLKQGTVIVLPEGSENITWYGNGDCESYSDRNSYTRVGEYTSTVSDMYYPFANPQDCGNLTGVKWISVTNPDTGYGVLVTGDQELNASALHFTAQQLNEAGHTYDLLPSEKTYLSIDAKVRGVGNESCGPSALEQYLVTDKTCSYVYTILPVSEQTDAMEISKQYPSVSVSDAEASTEPTESEQPMESPGSTEQSDNTDSISASEEPQATVQPTQTADPSSDSYTKTEVSKPKKVTGVKVKINSKKKWTVTWKKQNNVKYKIAYSTKKSKLNKLKNGKAGKVNGVKIVSVSVAKKTLKKLKSGKTYYIKVCAYRKKSGETVYGNWSAVVKKKNR